MYDLVSIIMPSYNTASYIRETIQSVINQTYTNWELIIMDDCSTDNTDEVVASTNIVFREQKLSLNKLSSGTIKFS